MAFIRKKRSGKSTFYYRVDARLRQTKEDWLAALGFAKWATPTKDDLKAAYRRLVKEHHPDYGGDAAAFRIVNEAYNALSGL